MQNKYIYFLAAMTLFSCSGPQNAKSFPEVTVDAEQLHAHVAHLADLSPPRNYKNIQSLNKAAEFLLNTLRSYGYEPFEQEFKVSDHSYKNIIVSYGPVAAPRFIVGAHYDVCYDQPGADDNGSGVAALLELARLLQHHTPKLAYRLDLAAYTLEEPPFFRTNQMGSHVHANSLHEQKIDVLGMVSLEMLGFFTDTPGSQKYPLPGMGLVYPSTGNFIAVVGNMDSGPLVRHFKNTMSHAAIGVETLKAPGFLVGVDFSDHYNFWLHGHQAVMITDTAFYRNPNYHQTSDTIDTLDFDRMQEVVKGLYWAVTNLTIPNNKKQTATNQP